MDMKLRKWRKEDAAGVAAYANNREVAMWMRDAFPHPYTLRDAREFVAGCICEESGNALMRAIEADGRAVGSIGIFVKDDVYRKSAEMGYWLAQPYWGYGLMTRAVVEMCAEAFDKLDIIRIFAEPFCGNAGSRRVLEKAGFTLEGVLRRSVYKNGTFQDSCVYALLKEEAR